MPDTEDENTTSPTDTPQESLLTQTEHPPASAPTRRNRTRSIVLVLVLFCVVAGAAITYRALQGNGTSLSTTSATSASDTSQNTSTASGTSSAKSVRTFSEFTVTDASGNEVALSSMQGKPTIVGYWATWCPYCVKEAPDIQDLYEEYGNRVNIMMIDEVGYKGETVDVGKQWATDNGYTYPIYFDTNGSASKAGQAYYLPTIYVLDSNSNIVFSRSGYGDMSTIRTTLSTLLDE